MRRPSPQKEKPDGDARLHPADIGGATHYGDPTRTRRTEQWDGAPGQRTESVQRSRATISGEIVRANEPDFDIMRDRLRGGLNLVLLWDFEQRVQNGWDLEPALNSDGDEFWHAEGFTADYAGESANPPAGPWRSVNATCNGGASADSTSLPVTALLGGEVIPRGAWVPIGDFRHRTLTAATADASGDTTLTLASPLRATVANGATVTIPGDLFVGALASMEVSPADVNGLRTFDATFVEVYEDELGGFTFDIPDPGNGGGAGPLTKFHSFTRDSGALFPVPDVSAGDYLIAIAAQADGTISLISFGGVAATQIAHHKQGEFDQCLFAYVRGVAAGVQRDIVPNNTSGTFYRYFGCLWLMDGTDPDNAVSLVRANTETAGSIATYDGGVRAGVMTGQQTTGTLTDRGIVGLETEDAAAADHTENAFYWSAASQNDTADSAGKSVSIEVDGDNLSRVGLFVSIPPA